MEQGGQNNAFKSKIGCSDYCFNISCRCNSYFTYSLLWGIGVIILLFLAIWPNSLIVLANLVGFQTVSNMVIGVLLVILFFITMSLTVIVSAQKRKITLLVQEISLLKSEIKK